MLLSPVVKTTVYIGRGVIGGTGNSGTVGTVSVTTHAYGRPDNGHFIVNTVIKKMTIINAMWIAMYIRKLTIASRFVVTMEILTVEHIAANILCGITESVLKKYV